jgi:hypothetical protein
MLDREDRSRSHRRRDPAPKQQEPTAEKAEPEVGPEPPPDKQEEPATDDTEDDEGPEPDAAEEDAAPAIEAPRSWNAEDRAKWAKAPPEVQEVFTRRQNEIDRAYQHKSQQFADEARASASERLRERQEYADNLQKLLFVASPEAQRFSQIDWTRLSRENPQDWANLTQAREDLRNRIGALQNELQRVQFQSQQERSQLEAQFKQQQLEMLRQEVPDIADPQKGPQLARTLNEWLLTQGFTSEEIGQVYDHRAIKLAVKAMQADRAAAARKQAVPNREPPPRVQQPGVKQRTDRATAPQRREQKLAAMKQSGINQGRTHDKDALAYLEEMLR